MLMLPLSPHSFLIFRDTHACQDTVKRQINSYLANKARTHRYIKQAALLHTHKHTHTRHPAELIPTLIICLLLVDHRVPKV